jgi:hypothetical protein
VEIPLAAEDPGREWRLTAEEPVLDSARARQPGEFTIAVHLEPEPGGERVAVREVVGEEVVGEVDASEPQAVPSLDGVGSVVSAPLVLMNTSYLDGVANT